MTERAICKRCVLPHSPPDLFLNEQGLCNICVQHEANPSGEAERPLLETDFNRMLKKHRGKGEYDCLVMCSGGKDSTSALYYMRERYKLRPLAFTFDHGFETEEAMANVKRAVEKLDVDFMMFRSTFMRDMFEKILKTGSKAVICHLCSIWYMDLTFKIAARFDTPIIIAGWTKGQSTRQDVMSKCACNVSAPEYRSMAQATIAFLADLKHDPKYKNFPQSMEEVLKRAKKRQKSIVLSPHWFLPFDTETYVETIRSHLNWRYPVLSYPGESTNCALNFISVYNSMKHYGYTHYHVEMSKHIRQGMLTREKALELLKIDFDHELLNEIAGSMDYRFAPGGE